MWKQKEIVQKISFSYSFARKVHSELLAQDSNDKEKKRIELIDQYLFMRKWSK
jgi:hypothetical protein